MKQNVRQKLDQELASIPLVSSSIGDDYDPAICMYYLSKKKKKRKKKKKGVKVSRFVVR